MSPDERFNAERDAFRKWMERWDSDQAIKLLGDVYNHINYRQNLELNLVGGRVREN